MYLGVEVGRGVFGLVVLPACFVEDSGGCKGGMDGWSDNSAAKSVQRMEALGTLLTNPALCMVC